ncbi:hypothetical protein Acsp06_31330 [Actinomycetospora sp. NBRC 106375]|nr:hypothetical protein Acsp06_31330 [Actinomycetospora sp. NBRC 106375]
MVFSARRLLTAALLVVAAVIWTRINKPVEGATLLELSSRHGITTADLLSAVALAMAIVIAWPSPRPASPTVAKPPRPERVWPGTTVPTASPPGAPGRRPGTSPGPARR